MSPRRSHVGEWLLSRRWALGVPAWAALAFTIAYWDHDENRRQGQALRVAYGQP